MAFVRRTRATLRSAEFGFFGVCVYTRMHTPRFSGHPASAGDFVFIRTASRPILTSCENVGTVVPLFHPATQRPTIARMNFRGSRQARTQKDARAQSSAERLTRLCGAGAPFRPLFCPIPSYFVPGPKIFPFQLNDSKPLGAVPLRVNASLTNTEV